MLQIAPPTITIILPCYNEQALLRANTTVVANHLNTLKDQYSWEILIVNDGSSDSTGDIADELAAENPNIRTLHNPTNYGVGKSIRRGIENTQSDVVITLDVDLSYDVNHIDQMLDSLIDTQAKMVLASPYMRGGTVANVPFIRRFFSVWGNRFLKIFIKGNFSTITSMARAYDGPFIRSLKFDSTGLDLMPEMLHKSLLLDAKVIEVPGRLDWGPQLAYADTRVSSLKIIRHVGSTLKTGYTLRPTYFLMMSGIAAGIVTLNVVILAKLAS